MDIVIHDRHLNCFEFALFLRSLQIQGRVQVIEFGCDGPWSKTFDNTHNVNGNMTNETSLVD